jgi:uncharacterized protein (DUF1800 family)
MAPLQELAPEHFGPTQARHLLNRAGFGGPPSHVSHLANQGLYEAVASLVDYHTIDAEPIRADLFDKDIVRPANEEERAEVQRARRRGDEALLERFRMEVQARQRADRRQMAEIQQWWMTRLIQSPRPLEEKLTLFWHGHFATAYRGTEDSYHMFLQNQLFRRHAAGNFADLCYGIIRDPAMLRYLNNDRNRRQAPNENLARELMELFTLGEGNVYTENDIKEGARALTGYTFEDDEFVFRRQWHDTGLKRIFGQVGTFDGDDLVRLILRKTIVAEFICMKLYRHFVNDAPLPLSRDAQQFVIALAGIMIRSQGQLRPVLKAMFLSRHFYDRRHIGSVIKSPVQLIVQAMRTFEQPVSDVRPLVRAAAEMAQNIFHPPSVKGWEVGRAWITTSTMFARQNFVMPLIQRTDAMGFVSGATTPDEAAVHLLQNMLATHPREEQVQLVKSIFTKHNNQINPQTVRGAMLLIAAMPEYQLC